MQHSSYHSETYGRPTTVEQWSLCPSEPGQYADMVQRGERPLGKQPCGEGGNIRD